MQTARSKHGIMEYQTCIMLLNSAPHKLFYVHKPYMHITCCAIIINVPSVVALFLHDRLPTTHHSY